MDSSDGEEVNVERMNNIEGHQRERSVSPEDNVQAGIGVDNQDNNEEMDVLMELVLEFQAVTGMEDMDESRRILQRHDWDLLQAISAHMGFEYVSPERIREMNSHPPVVHSAPLSPSSSSSSGNEGILARDDARRRGDTSNGGRGILGWIWRLVSAPFDIFFRYLWEFIGFGLRFLRQDPRRAITNPVEDVMSFIAAYEAKFGLEHPVFYQGSYSQALNDAKRELRFLLVYLHSDDHMDTPTFCRNVMPHQGFRDIIRENMLFWACSVSLPEGYRASQALRENTYPFLALIVLKNHRMTIVARFEGVLNPENLLGRIHQAVADNEGFLIAERQERLERSMTQTLRQQQDAAYLESLQADREKERKRKAEEEKKREEELEIKRMKDEETQRREDLRRQKEETAANLKPEPSPKDPNVIRIVIKLPNGARLERRFQTTDSLLHLYNFVFSHKDAPDNFEIATNFPKRTLNCKPTDEQPIPPTFLEFGLGKSEMLFVYDLES